MQLLYYGVHNVEQFSLIFFFSHWEDKWIMFYENELLSFVPYQTENS